MPGAELKALHAWALTTPYKGVTETRLRELKEMSLNHRAGKWQGRHWNLGLYNAEPLKTALDYGFVCLLWLPHQCNWQGRPLLSGQYFMFPSAVQTLLF